VGNIFLSGRGCPRAEGFFPDRYLGTGTPSANRGWEVRRATNFSESPDPLVNYRWPAPNADDDLQLYTIWPVSVTADAAGSFGQLDSLITAAPAVVVNGAGSIRMDFGQENAGWLEIDSPDLNGSVEMSISEYNEPSVENAGPAHPHKTDVPKKYGNTYRLELNRELYEGVRFGWVHVRKFGKPWRHHRRPAGLSGQADQLQRQLPLQRPRTDPRLVRRGVHGPLKFAQERVQRHPDGPRRPFLVDRRRPSVAGGFHGGDCPPSGSSAITPTASM
jgi:hypothetical protein